MTSNLIIDGNFLLNKMVFRLHKANIIGDLYQAFINNILDYRRMYPFAKLFFASDSRKGYWRKRMYPDYKATRRKDTDIDWKYVFETYEVVKQDLPNYNFNVVEYNGLEGDDWITYLTHRSNLDGASAFIVASDCDLTQLLKFNMGPDYMNIMFSMNSNNGKMYLPQNYHILMDELSVVSDNIFDMNDNDIFLNFINDLIKKNEVEEVDVTEMLITKIISGDKGDNIKSVFQKPMSNGKMRGIGDVGAGKLYKKYIEEFGYVDLSNDKYVYNMIDLICEDRKVVYEDNKDEIKGRWDLNKQLMQLDLETLPAPVVKKMTDIYEHLMATNTVFRKGVS